MLVPRWQVPAYAGVAGVEGPLLSWPPGASGLP